MFKPTAETAIAHVNRSDTVFGPAIAFAVWSGAKAAVEATDITNGTVAVALFSNGKVGNRPAAQGHDKAELSVSANTTSQNSQNVPDLAMILCHSGVVFACKYDTAQAPAVQDRVCLSSTTDHFGEVRIAPKVDSVQIYSEGEAVRRNNFVLELDTVNTEVLILLL